MSLKKLEVLPALGTLILKLRKEKLEGWEKTQALNCTRIVLSLVKLFQLACSKKLLVTALKGSPAKRNVPNAREV